jgi:hypothetical protein
VDEVEDKAVDMATRSVVMEMLITNVSNATMAEARSGVAVVIAGGVR